MYILLPLVIGYENDAPKAESLSTTGACHLAAVLPSVVLPCSGQCLRSLFVVVPGGFIGNIPVVLGSGVLNLSYQTKLLQYHFFFYCSFLLFLEKIHRELVEFWSIYIQLHYSGYSTMHMVCSQTLLKYVTTSLFLTESNIHGLQKVL